MMAMHNDNSSVKRKLMNELKKDKNVHRKFLAIAIWSLLMWQYIIKKDKQIFLIFQSQRFLQVFF